MNTLMKAAVCVAGAGALTAAGVAGYRYYQKRQMVKALAAMPGAASALSYVGANAQEVVNALGNVNAANAASAADTPPASQS